MIFHQGEFINRVNFAHHLNHHRLTGLALEVGTHRGEFSYQFLSIWKGKRLYCVDPWTIPEGYEEQAKLLPQTHGRDREDDYTHAFKLLSNRFGDRVLFFKMTSEQTVEEFPLSVLLDFVYIDGDHRYDMVLADLERWYPYIRRGGLLAGHDFISRSPYNAYLDVQRAVVDFARRYKLEIRVVAELETEPEFSPWSFYLVKP